MVIHQIFPKFAPRNQNVTDMKITTFNPDGSIKEVREHHFQIPKYISSFDPKRSFLNISDDDIRVLKVGNDFEKKELERKFRTLINYDLSIFTKFLFEQDNIESKNSFYDVLLRVSINQELLDKYRKALCSLVRRYSKSLRSLRNIKSEKLTDDEYQALNVNTLVEILLFDIIKMRSKGRSGMDCYKNMVHRLRWLNYALYNCYALGLLTDDRRINAQILRPYSNIRFPKGISLDDSSFLKRIVYSLYETGEQFRNDQYRLLLALKYLPCIEHTSMLSFDMSTIGMAINDKQLTTVLREDRSNEFENVRMELENEEIVALHGPCNISEEIKIAIKRVLDNQYKRYGNLNGNFDIKDMQKDIEMSYGDSYIKCNSLKYWREYYYKTMRRLSADFKENLKKNNFKDIEWPYYYYKVLVEDSDLCKEYKFEGQLLDGLLRLFINEKYEKTIALYEQVFRLNYMETEADFINSIESSKEKVNAVKNEEMQHYLDNLLKSENRIIAEHILKGNLFCTKDDVVDYAIVFLEPLFKKYLTRNTNEVQFRETFKKVLKLDFVFKHLIVEKSNSNIEKDTLHIKTLMNIIGILLNEFHNWKKPIEVQNSVLISDLITMWNITKIAGYARYISGYRSRVSNPISTTSVFTENEVNEICKYFANQVK